MTCSGPAGNLPCDLGGRSGQAPAPHDRDRLGLCAGHTCPGQVLGQVRAGLSKTCPQPPPLGWGQVSDPARRSDASGATNPIGCTYSVGRDCLAYAELGAYAVDTAIATREPR